MKKSYKLFLIILIMLFTNKVSATPANTAFEDDQFYNCIILKLNTDGFNAVYDRDPSSYKVTKDELESIVVLKCNDANIVSTKGLELLTNLTDLNLSDNNISTISLTSNLKIANLLLSNNKLASLDLSKNTEIENLYVNGNQLTSLNLSNNKKLLVLNINNNKFSALNLENNSKIIDLKANDNAFITQSKVVFKGDSLTLTPDIKFAQSENTEKWLNPSWSTKDANIATINQKGTIQANGSGNINIVAAVEDVYSFIYNIKVLEITSDVYNIDNKALTISVNDASISKILSNIKAINGELMIYNTNNKYVTSGNISSGFTLKVMYDARVLKTYTLTLVQNVVNNDLETLEVKNYNIDFDKDKTNYTIIVENDVSELNINAIPVESSATVTIEGNENFEDGTNSINIVVTGKDKSTKTYIITVIKKAKEVVENNSNANVYLEKLEIKDYKINFDKKVDFYSIKIDEEIEKLNIIAEAEDNQASVEIVGNENLKNKSKIEIIVSAIDGAKKVYTLSIQKNAEGPWKIILIVLELLALLLMILLCIILIKKHNKKTKNKTKKIDAVMEVQTSKTEVKTNDKTETHLEKTIRFRRVCKKCGAVNVLTNENCYLCGEKLDEN